MAHKLYVVVRKDLPAGDQLCQAIHAAIQYAHDHPEPESRWFKESNHLAVLNVEDEPALEKLLLRAQDLDVTYSRFTEPDLNDSLTAIALEPGNLGKKVCKGLERAFK